MRRVRGDRDDYDYPGLDDLFQDLAIDPQDPRIRRMLHHQFAEGYGFDHRFFDQNRSSDEHRNSGERRNPSRPNINSDHGFERGLTLARPGSAALPFRRAFKDLHRELVQAEEWYNACLTEYDNDVQPIRNYSSVEDLTNIWAAKVRGERDRRTMAEGDDEQADNGTKTFREVFAETETKVANALQAAADSTLKMPVGRQLSERQRVKFDACEGLKQRAQFELQQLLNYMERAKESRDACRHLVNQLQQFKEAVNPESGMNRETFKCGDDDDEELTGGQSEE
jgi:hypothetical protein